MRLDDFEKKYCTYLQTHLRHRMPKQRQKSLSKTRQLGNANGTKKKSTLIYTPTIHALA
jgi:hypothetical protein